MNRQQIPAEDINYLFLNNCDSVQSVKYYLPRALNLIADGERFLSSLEMDSVRREAIEATGEAIEATQLERLAREQAQRRADQAQQQTAQAQQRADRLAEQLRAAGIEPSEA